MLRDHLRTGFDFVLFIGPSEAGKTSLLYRLATDEFKEDWIPTPSFVHQIIKNTNIIEIGGQKLYKKNLWPEWLARNPSLIIFVIDITKMEDFEAYNAFTKDYPDIANLILVANKLDLDEKRIPNDYPEYLQQLDHYVLLCSAKTGVNIWTLGEIIAERSSEAVLNQRLIKEPDVEQDIEKEKEKDAKQKSEELINKFKEKF
ncbi:MAG: ADP-ribosylation factor-like protein [Candidatus Hermodarchaeota archaeon]